VTAKLTDANGNWKFPLLSDQQAGFNPRRLLDTQLNNWGRAPVSPGTLPSGTVLRGGYGIFYSRYPIQYLLQTVAVNPPFAGTFSYSQSIQNGVPALTLDAPIRPAAAQASLRPGFKKICACPPTSNGT
jgi:hypothetical protein